MPNYESLIVEAARIACSNPTGATALIEIARELRLAGFAPKAKPEATGDESTENGGSKRGSRKAWRSGTGGSRRPVED